MADTEPSVQQKMKMFEKQGKPNKPTSSRPPAGAVSRRIQQVERTTNKSFGGKESEVTKSIKDNPFMRQHTDGAMKNGAIKKKLPPPKGEGEGGGGGASGVIRKSPRTGGNLKKGPEKVGEGSSSVNRKTGGSAIKKSGGGGSGIKKSGGSGIKRENGESAVGKLQANPFLQNDRGASDPQFTATRRGSSAAAFQKNENSAPKLQSLRQSKQQPKALGNQETRLDLTERNQSGPKVEGERSPRRSVSMKFERVRSCDATSGGGGAIPIIDGDGDTFESMSVNAAMRLGGVRSIASKSIVPVEKEDEDTAIIQSAMKFSKSPRGQRQRPQSEMVPVKAMKTDSLAWPPFSNRAGNYKGEIDSRGIPNGVGELVWPDGSRYMGTWVFGRRQGPGSFMWANGNIYEGMWHEDKRHGQGTEINKHDKSKLVATFQRGRVNGAAILELKTGLKIQLIYVNGILQSIRESQADPTEQKASRGAKRQSMMGIRLSNPKSGKKKGLEESSEEKDFLAPAESERRSRAISPDPNKKSTRRGSVFASISKKPKKKREEVSKWKEEVELNLDEDEDEKDNKEKEKEGEKKEGEKKEEEKVEEG